MDEIFLPGQEIQASRGEIMSTRCANTEIYKDFQGEYWFGCDDCFKAGKFHRTKSAAELERDIHLTGGKVA